MDVEISPEPTAVSAPLSAWCWHLHLILRPRAFFREFATRRLPLLVAVCAWMYGMETVIDRASLKVLGGQPVPWMEDWSSYWGVVLGAGAFGGLVFYWFGSWWYRVRIRWSGDMDPDARVAKRVYLFSSQVHALPALVLAAFLEPWRYPNPLASFEGDPDAWDLLTVAVLGVAVLWSLGTSYVGVRTMFRVDRLPALVWFAILPACLYVVVLLGMLAVLLPALLLDKEPDLQDLRSHRSSELTFQYPGNWQVQRSDEIVGGSHLELTGPPDATIRLMTYPSTDTPEDELEATLESLADNHGWQEGARFEFWAGLSGQGLLCAFTVGGTALDATVFVTELAEEHMLEMQAYYAREDAPHVIPVLELLERSLRLH